MNSVKREVNPLGLSHLENDVFYTLSLNLIKSQLLRITFAYTQTARSLYLSYKESFSLLERF